MELTWHDRKLNLFRFSEDALLTGWNCPCLAKCQARKGPPRSKCEQDCDCSGKNKEKRTKSTGNTQTIEETRKVEKTRKTENTKQQQKTPTHTFSLEKHKRQKRRRT